MKSKLKKYVMELNTLGPVHVGNGEKHTPFEFVYEPKSKKIGLLNEGKWMNFLRNNGLYEKYEKDALIENFKVYNWMCSNNIDPWDKDIYRYIITGVEQDKEKGLNDVHCQIKNYKGEPYIPGSSIKGMIRTAIFSYHLYKNRLKFSNEWEYISSLLKSKDWKEIKKVQRIVSELEFKCFGKLPQKNPEKSVNSQLLDVFRGISVSDTCTTSVENITVVQKNDWGVKTKDKGKTLPLWREAIKKDVSLKFDITMDLENLKYSKIGISSVEDLLNILHFHYSNILLNFESHFELKNINEVQSSPQNPAVYLGGGTGFHAKSILYSLAPDIKSARETVAHFLDYSFKDRHKHVICDTEISPRTLKLAKTQSGLLKMGICSIKVVDEIASDD